MLLLFAALALLTAAQNRRLCAARRTGLPEAPAYAAQVPPFINFLTVGLGGFRGVAAEALWSRADSLQEEGRYFELVQLSEWITWLDPHATEAWAYNAWNMAYNISVLMRRPADRLRWVAHGIALLRDRGLPANPHNARLYRELAWLYQHKVGSTDDSAHIGYKLALAHELSPFLRPDGSVVDTPTNRTALAALHLDVDRMRTLELRFGPLDWRMAPSHAIYWASQGLAYAHGAELLACRRAIYQPLIQCALAGRFDGDPIGDLYRAKPNPEVVRPALQFVEETFREAPTPGVRNAYAFFLLQAIHQAHAAGHATQANDWLHDLNRIGEGFFHPMTIEAVVRGEMPEFVR